MANLFPKDFQLGQRVYGIVSEYMEIGEELNPYDVHGYSPEIIMEIHDLVEDLRKGDVDGHIDALKEEISWFDEDCDLKHSIESLLDDFIRFKADFAEYQNRTA